MNKLTPQTKLLRALKMDKNFIYIKCEFCKKTNNDVYIDRNLSQSKKHKDVYHIYNSFDDFKNRVIFTKSHCLFNKGDIRIIINNETLRINSF